MDYITSQVEWGHDRQDLAKMLEDASKELKQAADLISGRVDDILVWSDETKKIKAKL